MYHLLPQNTVNYPKRNNGTAMTVNFVMSFLGAIVSLIGLLLSVIVCILYLKRASSSQWYELTWQQKYIQPLLVILGCLLFMDLGLIVMLAFGNDNQVTKEDLVISFNISMGFSGCLWLGYMYVYLMSSISWSRTRLHGSIPEIDRKRLFLGIIIVLVGLVLISLVIRANL